MNRYPPLNTLIALDAAMRCNSFSIAAEELCVTPGAIGQQIRKLEAWLGFALFHRRTRQVLPTEDGLRYWQRIRPALAQIREAGEALCSSQRHGVWLSMPPTFAAKWFTRHMADFLTRHPDTELHLDSAITPVDFENSRVDLAVRYFDGKSAELDASLLFTDDARVYGHPDYIARLGLRQPEDLLRATLLDAHFHPHWTRWLEHCSALTPGQIAAIPTLHFDQALLAIEAARRGQGLVLTSRLVTEEECAAGTLVEPFAYRLPLDSGYYVVHPKRRPLRAAPAQFKAWLLETCRPAG